MNIISGIVRIDTKYMTCGPHCYFEGAHASITITDENGKVVKKRIF